ALDGASRQACCGKPDRQDFQVDHDLAPGGATERVERVNLCLTIFSHFGRIVQNVFDWKSNRLGLPQLPKTIHTPRHKKLCELLKARRKAAGLTQTVVAERLGKPPSYVARYEGGDRRLD